MNYQCLIWNQSDTQFPDLPRPEDGHGWCINQHGGKSHLDYVWTDEHIVPQEVADLLVNSDESLDENEMQDFDINDDLNIVDEDEDDDVDID